MADDREDSPHESIEQRAGTLLEEGCGREAVDLLVDRIERAPDPDVEQLLVRTRHRAAVAMPAGAPPDRRPAAGADPFPGDGLPEVKVDDLTAEVLGAALRHRGALLVRDLLDRATADGLLDDARRAVDAAARSADGAPVAETAPWYVPFEAEEAFDFGDLERRFTREIGGVLTVESPRALAHVISAFRSVGLGDVLAAHLGQWPMLSAKKSTLRRAGPSSPKEWHQDGAFLGTGTRTVNVWVALTPCGVDAPGIDVFPRSFDHIVETGTDSALFHWSVSHEQAERLGTPWVSPVFEPGDALLFDQMTLHRSNVEPSMTRDRYAIESWFFAPGAFPYEQVPILF